MTNEVKISYPESGITVDFTNLNVKVTHLNNNPLILIPTPLAATPVGGSPALGANIKGINIGFVTNRYLLNFILTDGLGTLDFGGSGTTNYEKIVYITNNSSTINPKTLTINGRDFNAHIESFNISFAAGDKDLALNCSLNCILVDDIKMVG